MWNRITVEQYAKEKGVDFQWKPSDNGIAVRLQFGATKSHYDFGGHMADKMWQQIRNDVDAIIEYEQKRVADLALNQ